MKIYSYTNVVEKSQNDLENQFNFIVDKLKEYLEMEFEDANDLVEISKLLEICDEILIIHVLDSFYILENGIKINCQEYIDGLLVKLLSKTYYDEDKEVGYVLIEDYINDYKLLGYSLLLFDFYSVTKKYDLDNVRPKIQLMKEEYDYIGLAVHEENLAYININTSVGNYCDEDDYKFEVDILNKQFLKTIRHEIRHFIQIRKSKEKKYVNKLDELYDKFQEKLMKIDRNYIDGTYNLLHAHFPYEYDADEFAFTELFDLFVEKIFVDHRIFKEDYLEKNIHDLITFDSVGFETAFILGDISDESIELYHYDNYIGYGDYLSYPNCNLLPRMYSAIEYITNNIRKCIENSEKVDNYFGYSIFELIKIAQEVLKLFPDYEEEYIKPLKECSLGEIEPVFLDFNYENVLKGKLNIKRTFLNSSIGRKFMRQYDYYKNPNKDIVNDFELDLIFQGYTPNQIEELYKKCYENNKDILDFMYFMNFLTQQTKYRIKQQAVKKKELKL